jgi:hypothetical protein
MINYHDVPTVGKPNMELCGKIDRVLKWVERGIIPMDDAIDRMHWLIAHYRRDSRCGMSMVKVIH